MLRQRQQQRRQAEESTKAHRDVESEESVDTQGATTCRSCNRREAALWRRRESLCSLLCTAVAWAWAAA